MDTNDAMVLTPRQLDVLRAYALTGSRKVAAYRLGIASQTLDNHLTECFKRLGVTDAISAFRALCWLIVPDADAEWTDAEIQAVVDWAEFERLR